MDPGAAAATARLFLLLLFVVAAEWISFPGGVDGVATAAAARILSSGALSRLVSAPLQRRWRALGGVFRSSWRAARRQVSPLAFCLVETEQAMGFVDDGWPDLARLPLGGDGRRWRARFRELQRPGRVLGQWATADGDFYCDSFKRQGAMGPRQLTVKLGFFLDGDSWRRRGRLQGIHEGSRGFFA